MERQAESREEVEIKLTVSWGANLGDICYMHTHRLRMGVSSGCSDIKIDIYCDKKKITWEDLRGKIAVGVSWKTIEPWWLQYISFTHLIHDDKVFICTFLWQEALIMAGVLNTPQHWQCLLPDSGLFVTFSPFFISWRGETEILPHIRL